MTSLNSPALCTSIRRSLRWSFVLVVLLSCTVGSAGEPVDLDEQAFRTGYSIGYQIGGDFKRQGVELDSEMVVRGIEDALSGAEPLLSPAEMRNELTELQRSVTAEQQARAAEQAEENRAAARDFLEGNRSREGVQLTASGLQYEVVEDGTGPSPGPNDTVNVHYRGTRVDGSVFDSSYDRGQPATFRVEQVIPGFAEGLQLMRQGGIYRLYVPPELSYDSGPLAGQTLIFEIELLQVEPGGAGAPPALDEAE
jgi:FKBP-type peptidyl-prolyl cis-trans isomerase FklB